MEDIINQCVETYKSFWNIWSSRDAKRTSRLKALIDPEFNGFGSNIDEIWKSQKDLLLQHDKEASQIKEPYSIEINWFECTKINENSVMVYGVISIKVNIKKKIIILENVRNSFLFQKTANEIKIKHWHCSLPDIGVKGEVVPGSLEPKRYEKASVFFCDFVNFTETVSDLAPKKIFIELSDIYQNFDEIIENENLEKIQVYGDGYLAVGGLSNDSAQHALDCINAGKKILAYLQKRNKHSEFKWNARIGVHTGPLIAGIIGERKFSFNIFGDTVNTSARIETASLPNKINISQSTYELVKDNFTFEYRGKIEVKGKGKIDMYFVE